MIDYQPIRVSTLRGDLKIPFDVYLRIAGKFIHYCRAGDSFEGKRLEKLREKKLKTLFIRPEDEIPYAQYLEQSVESAYDPHSGKTLEVRAEVIQGFQEAATEEFMENPDNESAYNHAHSSTQRFLEFLNRQPFAAAPILNIRNHDCGVAHHGVNVATLTLLMAANSGHKDSSKLHLLGLGCLLHDIDHFGSGQDLSRPLESLNAAELAHYKDHPRRGGQKLQGTRFVDQIVMNVITQHGEHIDGTGFPKGLFEKDIEPVVLLAAAADAYDRLVSFGRKEPKEAMKTLMIDKLGALPLGHFKSLAAVLKNIAVL